MNVILIKGDKMSILKMIYSCKKDGVFKHYRILGIKINKKDKIAALKKELASTQLKQNTYLSNLFQSFQVEKNLKDENFTIDKLRAKVKKIKKAPTYLQTTSHQNYLNVVLGCEPFEYEKNNIGIDGAYICWGIRPSAQKLRVMGYANDLDRDVLFFEDAFLRSADTFANAKAPERFIKGISFTVDDLSSYFDATKPTRMEMMLNDKNLVITEEQKQRARACINKIVENHLTKYNHQPIFEPNIGREGHKKVLVIDQTFGDMSILKGWGDEQVFAEMLEAAIRENPDADIIVKTHPDTMTGKKGGYYTRLTEHDNIYLQKEPINPISLINYVDKVYVCTTQFGFEALMCGKEVHVFGMPFYANWGLTIDAQHNERRNNTRTLEEVFYIAYILYSIYVNPDTNSVCEIEDAIDYLLKIRDEYNDYKKQNLE